MTQVGPMLATWTLLSGQGFRSDLQFRCRLGPQINELYYIYDLYHAYMLLQPIIYSMYALVYAMKYDVGFIVGTYGTTTCIS